MGHEFLILIPGLVVLVYEVECVIFKYGPSTQWVPLVASAMQAGGAAYLPVNPTLGGSLLVIGRALFIGYCHFLRVRHG